MKFGKIHIVKLSEVIQFINKIILHVDKVRYVKDQLIGSKSYPFKIVPVPIAMSSNIFSASFKALSSRTLWIPLAFFPFRLIEGLNYFGVDLDKFKTSLETLTDKITAELKNAGINIPGLRGLGKGLGLGNRWSYRNTATTTPLSTLQLSKVYQVVASSLGTSTTNLDNLREKYDVGLVEIIKLKLL